mgnify:CR=1 FL=1
MQENKMEKILLANVANSQLARTMRKFDRKGDK